MKIKTKDWRGESVENIEYLVSRALRGDRDGVAENAQESADKAADALGRLVNLLAERGLMSAEDIVNVAGLYVHDKPELRGDG